MKQFNLLLILCLMLLNSYAQAQEKKTHFNVRAGFSIGGASPIGFPESIRKIDKFNPGLLLSLEAGAAYNISKQWAIASALRFEQKGMTTEARVKGYYTTFNAGSRSGAESITGFYTGNVETAVKNSYMTVPVHLVRNFNSPFSIKAGGFVSLLLEKKFTGSARDGYLRDQTPVGEKEEIKEAAYDFSDQIRKINAGIELGADYRIHSHLTASLHFNWGLIPVMKKDFQSIDFKLYNLFANLGVAYRF
jgi:hypothetical protein